MVSLVVAVAVLAQLASLAVCNGDDDPAQAAAISVDIVAFNADQLFHCSTTAISYNPFDEHCHLLQRFCLGPSSMTGVGDSILCRRNIKSYFSVQEREIKIMPGPWPYFKATDKIPAKVVNHPADKDSAYDCTKAVDCYPYRVTLKVPPSVMAAKTLPILHVILAEVTQGKDKRGVSVLYQQSFPVQLPKVAGSAAANRLKPSLRVKVKRKLCQSVESSVFEKLRKGLNRIIDQTPHRVVVNRIFNFLAHFVDTRHEAFQDLGGYHLKEDPPSGDRKEDPPLGQLCMTFIVGVQCLPGYGPAGNCSQILPPCAMANQKPASGKTVRQKRGVPAQAEDTPCRKHVPAKVEQDDSLGTKVTIGVGGAVTSGLLGLVVYLMKLYCSRKQPSHSKAASGEHILQMLDEDEDADRACDCDSVLSDECEQPDSDGGMTDIYSTVRLQRGSTLVL